MKHKIFIFIALLCAGLVFSYIALKKEQSTGLKPIDSAFEVEYFSSTKGASLGSSELAGHLNYKAFLKLKVLEKKKDNHTFFAELKMKSIDSKPEVLNLEESIHFQFIQKSNGLIRKISVSEHISNEAYSIVLNLLTNLSHKLFLHYGEPVIQDVFTGEYITKYSELSVPVTNRKVSFKYENTKSHKMSGGGYVLLEDAFYKEIKNKYIQTRRLYDRREQISDVSFTMLRVDFQGTKVPELVTSGLKVKDSLSGINLKSRFKLEEMKNLIWMKQRSEIRADFLTGKSDGQPWYEYMAYYYVNQDKRSELNEDFKQYPEKRGDIALVMTAIGDDLAQKQFVDLVSSQSPGDQNNYFRYGVFVENPNEDLIEAYKGFSSQSGKQAETAEKILASLYHKHLGSGEYDTDVGNLISGLNSDSVKDQRHRYSVLGNLGYPQVPQNLGSDLSSSDEDIERLAIDSLRFNEDQESYEILKVKAESNNSAVRLSALESLRGDYIDDAFDFYEGRMQVEGNKDNRLQLLKNIFELRNTDPRYVDLVSNEVNNCAYQEICTAAQKMLNEMQQ